MLARKLKDNRKLGQINSLSSQLIKGCNLNSSILDDFYQTFFQHSPDAVFLVDQMGEIVWFNQAAEIFIILKGDQEISFAKETISIIENIIKDSFKDQREIQSLEKTCIIKGNVHTFLWDTRIITENKQTMGIVLIAKDISRSRLLHEEIMHSNMQRVVDQVASGLAHEIRNPLTAVRGFIQLLYENLRRSLEREYLQVALEELDRANGFIKDFLLYTRPEAPDFSLTSLAQVIEDALSYIQPQASENGLDFELISKNALPLMYLDQEQITRAIKNVLQNAVDFTKQGKIEIEVINDVKSAKVNLIVQDPGLGISEQNISRIFEPFFTTKDDATGMGLTLTQSIIKSHGGKISVYNNKEKGTVVNIELCYVSQYSV